MNKQDFLQAIASPAELGKADHAPLKELLDAFPYSQTLQLLYAKSLNNASSIHYHRQLKLAAGYATDRKQLYRLIMQPALTRTIEEVEQVAARTPALVTEAPVSVPQEPAPSVEESALPIAPPPVDLLSYPTPPATPEGPLVPEPEEEGLGDLEKEILREAVSASISTEVTEELGEPEVHEEPAEAPSPPPPPRSYAEWLDRVDGEADGEVESSAPVDPAPLAETSSSTSALIDKFIANEPQITPGKAEFFSPTNMAKLSLVEDEDFVTETLATVYIQQGHYQKAINVYERLRLTNPGKSAYFAALIRETEEKLKQK